MPDTLRAIDTNVLLRYLLKDHPEHSDRARRLVESDELLGITVVALAEVAWTLAGPRLQFERAAIAMQLSVLLGRDNIIAVGFDKAETQAALLTSATPTGAANFGDALIAACARSAGVLEIYSFDQRFARAGLTPILPQ